MGDQESKKVVCERCGSATNHTVIASHREQWGADEDVTPGRVDYQIVKCKGCDDVRFVRQEVDFEDFGGVTESTTIYPEVSPSKARKSAFDFDEDLPEAVEKMYRESNRAYDVGAHTLCGVGLRAIVEALCKDQGVSGRDLKMKIDALVTKGVLARVQADALHEERYLGNAAVHEMETPRKKDLDDGFTIIEGLLRAIYILPVHTENLKKTRAKREATKSARKASTASTNATKPKS